MNAFPKLKYPIHTKGLSNENRMILLAYDICWRARERFNGDIALTTEQDYLHDLCANLSNLGAYIEANLCAGDMATRFEEAEQFTELKLEKINPEIT